MIKNVFDSHATHDAARKYHFGLVIMFLIYIFAHENTKIDFSSTVSKTNQKEFPKKIKSLH